MDASILTGIIGAGAALVGSLGAISIGNRYALRLERMRSALIRREHARAVGSEILLTAGKLTMVLAVTVGMAKPLQQASRQNPSVMEELIGQVEPLQAAAFTLAEATMRFRLTFNELDLATMAKEIAQGADEVGIAFAGFAGAFAMKESVPESLVSEFMAKAERVGQKLRAFEDELVSRLSEPLPASA